MRRRKNLSHLSTSSTTATSATKTKTMITIAEQSKSNSNSIAARKDFPTSHQRSFPGVARQIHFGNSTSQVLHFLERCANCGFNLSPGFDTYIYRCFAHSFFYLFDFFQSKPNLFIVVFFQNRGDTAFCSSNCREEFIKHDFRWTCQPASGLQSNKSSDF